MSTSVLLVGDIMLDRSMFGTAVRLAPEGTVPVVNVKSETTVLGGCGNVLQNLLDLSTDYDIELWTRVGDDSYGALVKKLVKELNIACAVYDERKHSDWPTIVKTRVYATDRLVSRHDFECRPNQLLKGARTDRFLFRWRTIRSRVKYLIVSDYNKGMIADWIVPILRECRERGIKTFVDPKGSNFSKYTRAYCIKPNLYELYAMCGSSLPAWNEQKRIKPKEIGKRAASLMDAIECEHVVVTVGPHGILHCDRSGGCTLHETKPVLYPKDVVGAGDTTLSMMVYNDHHGLRIEKNAKQYFHNLNMGGRSAVSFSGNFHMSSLLFAFVSQGLPAHKYLLCGSTDLTYAPSALRNFLALHTKRNHRVGFTNGCFDICHRGHLHVLETAKANCDVLIVGLNTDDSVRNLKGPSRPKQPLAERAEFLAQLPCVDYVVAFGEETPEALLQHLRPDVIVKGGDYTPERIKGRRFCKDVVIVPICGEHSTTRTVQRIVESAINPARGVSGRHVASHGESNAHLLESDQVR